jgi:hypothetical protein
VGGMCWNGNLNGFKMLLGMFYLITVLIYCIPSSSFGYFFYHCIYSCRFCVLFLNSVSHLLFFTFVPCILILSKLFIHQLLHKRIVLKTILKFTLKLKGYNLQRRGTAHTLPVIVLFYVLFVCK